MTMIIKPKEILSNDIHPDFVRRESNLMPKDVATLLSTLVSNMTYTNIEDAVVTGYACE